MFERLHEFTFTHKLLHLKLIIMKYLVVVVAVVFVLFAGSCTQRTCPTYTKGLQEMPEEQNDNAVSEEAKI
jgi:hypothetical protein